MPFDKEGLKTICVDFNGVLDTYEGYKDGKEYPPRPGARWFLSELKRRGYRVIIMTSASVWKVETWLDKYDLRQFTDGVTNIKVPAIVYVDDRAVQFKGNFGDALSQIVNFKTFWEKGNVQETPTKPGPNPNDNPGVLPE